MILDFLAKTALYTFILFHVAGGPIDVLLVAAAILALEFFSYSKGIMVGMEIQLEKAKKND